VNAAAQPQINADKGENKSNGNTMRKPPREISADYTDYADFALGVAPRGIAKSSRFSRMMFSSSLELNERKKPKSA
jgi:hypothetical protein